MGLQILKYQTSMRKFEAYQFKPFQSVLQEEHLFTRSGTEPGYGGTTFKQNSGNRYIGREKRKEF